MCADDVQAGPALAWLEYPNSETRLILLWLPSKLAAWISENFGQGLLIPLKHDLEWSVRLG